MRILSENELKNLVKRIINEDEDIPEKKYSPKIQKLIQKIENNGIESVIKLYDNSLPLLIEFFELNNAIDYLVDYFTEKIREPDVFEFNFFRDNILKLFNHDINYYIDFLKKNNVIQYFVDYVDYFMLQGYGYDVLRLFNNGKQFYNFLEEYNLSDKINIMDSDYDDIQLQILKAKGMSEEDWNYILGRLEITKVGDKLIYSADSENISELFESSRSSYNEIVKELLDGTYYPDWLDIDESANVIYDVLTKENQKKIITYLIENHLEELDLEPRQENETDEQYKQRINKYVTDNIEEYLDNINYDEYNTFSEQLKRSGDDAYKNSYESELYDEMWNELSEFFDGHEKIYNEKSKKEYFEFDVTNKVRPIVESHIENSNIYNKNFNDILDYVDLILDRHGPLYLNTDINPYWGDNLNKYFDDYFFE